MATLNDSDRLLAQEFFFESKLNSEIDRITSKLLEIPDEELADNTCLLLYQEEIAAAKEKVKYWKNRSDKGSRPAIYKVYKELQRRLEELAAAIDSKPITIVPPTSSVLADKDLPLKKLSLPELALFLIYTGQVIRNDDKAISLARAEGHNSGTALYIDFCAYSQQINRIGFDSATAKRGRNMIKRIENVLPRLNGNAKNKAENEIVIIENRIQ